VLSTAEEVAAAERVARGTKFSASPATATALSATSTAEQKSPIVSVDTHAPVKPASSQQGSNPTTTIPKGFKHSFVSFSTRIQGTQFSVSDDMLYSNSCKARRRMRRERSNPSRSSVKSRGNLIPTADFENIPVEILFRQAEQVLGYNPERPRRYTIAIIARCLQTYSILRYIALQYQSKFRLASFRRLLPDLILMQSSQSLNDAYLRRILCLAKTSGLRLVSKTRRSCGKTMKTRLIVSLRDKIYQIQEELAKQFPESFSRVI